MWYVETTCRHRQDFIFIVVEVYQIVPVRETQYARLWTRVNVIQILAGSS